jgi:CCR4-NOT transcription complex subunit 6
LNLTNNSIRNLPYELGKLFRLQSLGLMGNPLPAEIYTIYTESNGLQKLLTYFLDSLPSSLNAVQPPPPRSWLRLASPNTTQPTAIFTIMNYNILCDKYATRHVYGYCPSWALKWDYRRKQILEELRSYSADIIALQEIETDQFHSFFLPELQKNGYDGVFNPKSRAKTMSEQDRRYVDGCAIFYRQSKFRLIKHYLVEFNQLAMSAANGAACHDMMNRVMTKDNIGLMAFLETKEEIYSHTFSNGVLPSDHKQMLFVCTAHIHWDPEYCDVKVIQTLMLLSEIKAFMEDAIQKHRPNSTLPIDCSSVPLVLCGDFNSLPDSGVIELMRNGKISFNHADFKDLSYEAYLQKYNKIDANPTSNMDIAHHFKLQSAYETTSAPIMPYTNFTYDFKGIIDYVFYSMQLMRVLGVLGPLDPEWVQTNKIIGCPNPNVPSDHFSLLVEFELNPTVNENSKTSTIRRQ